VILVDPLTEIDIIVAVLVTLLSCDATVEFVGEQLLKGIVMAMRNKIRLKWRKNKPIMLLSTLFRLVLSRAVLFSIITCFQLVMLRAEELPFRFHILEAPESFDPVKARSTISSYLLNSIYMPLLHYSDGKLRPAGAKKCAFIHARQVRCDLDPNWFWSDGQKVKPSEVVNGFKALFVEKSVRAESFLQVKGAREIWSNKDQPANFKNLGIHAGRTSVTFDLVADDGDFLFRLIDTALTPRRESPLDGRVTSGYYFVSNVTPNRSIYLKPNTFRKPANRPDIEIIIVAEDDTALRLFQKKGLNFLRRLPTEYIQQYQVSPEYFVQPLLRFDYIGFGSELTSEAHLREQLIDSLQAIVPAFRTIVHSQDSTINCLGLRAEITGGDLCYEDKGAIENGKENVKTDKKLLLGFASQGGDDVRRTMELLQSAWKKSGLKVELSPYDVHVLESLVRGDVAGPNRKANTPTLFRRGVNLDRPTCLAALELFESTNPNNLIHFKDVEYDKKVQALRSAKDSERMSRCRAAATYLMAAKRFIPLGRIVYTVLRDDKFDGYRLNELNQLDVSGLRAARSTK